jgi:hypothetical protein
MRMDIGTDRIEIECEGRATMVVMQVGGARIGTYRIGADIARNVRGQFVAPHLAFVQVEAPVETPTTEVVAVAAAPVRASVVVPTILTVLSLLAVAGVVLGTAVAVVARFAQRLVVAVARLALQGVVGEGTRVFGRRISSGSYGVRLRCWA